MLKTNLQVRNLNIYNLYIEFQVSLNSWPVFPYGPGWFFYNIKKKKLIVSMIFFYKKKITTRVINLTNNTICTEF